MPHKRYAGEVIALTLSLLLLHILLSRKPQQLSVDSGHGSYINSSSVVTGIADFLPEASATHHIDSHHQEFRGILPDKKYNKAQKRGQKLWQALDCGASWPSQFTEYENLDDWGWDQDPAPEQSAENILRSSQDFFSAIRLSSTSDKNKDVRWVHKKEKTIGNTIYKPTSGKYYNIYNVEQGVIVAYSNYGPEWFKREKKGTAAVMSDDDALPQLRKWSDVVFLEWSRLASPEQLKNLRYVVRLLVLNPDTLKILQKALKKDGVSSGVLPKWPGHTFNPLDAKGKENKAFQAVLGKLSLESCPWKAVLGTPNAFGVAYMLLQHQEQLGGKTIKGVRVFDKLIDMHEPGTFELSMWIELEGREGA